ncbi:hypothetical protein H6P81_008103 [Aristolochia fimbriata]|uniref:DUF7356 domain-containing protein n=1 Tax=Aristolochia fimbriata TaxID=158543 RepID=A0AAV7F3G3_ARIFI|nr:hypothetical protein H6P81_008103 [Aristolochia fimbriata]
MSFRPVFGGDEVPAVGRGSGSPYGEIVRVLSGLEHNRKLNGKNDSPSPSPMPVAGGDKSGTSSSRVQSEPKQNSGGSVDTKPSRGGDGGGGGDVSGGNQEGGQVGTGKGIKDDGASRDPGDNRGTVQCDPLENRCTLESRLMACLRPGNGPSKLYLVVKNEGDDDLSVNIKIPSFVMIDQKVLQLPKHQLRQVNISLTTEDSVKIVLDAGHGVCSLHSSPPESTWDFIQNIPSYATRMTPIYGAYILFSTVMIVGGIWACWKFMRRSSRVDGGIPYQELEMGLPQSSSAIEVDTADGWDQGWDDEWEAKPRSGTSEIRPVSGVSANGLTARTANREGWDDDWDD